MTVQLDNVAEFNLLMLGMVLRVFRTSGRAQYDELKKLLDFVDKMPRRFAAEARSVLDEFDRETGIWNFVGQDDAVGQMRSEQILNQLRMRV
ncbi:MAG: hypothetical protein K8F25_10780 [Fimbriimonadaceae bacterium]|nr:hypothetical protein [Alphaproteobacteria bacterium]